MRGLDYPALAARVLAPFTAGCFDEADLLRLARRAYAEFDHAATAPLRHLAGDDWLLELFHGPTLAFKDFAMQLLAAMFDEVLARRGAAGDHRRRHLGRHRGGGRPRLRRQGARSASRCCTRRAGSRRCSGGR